MVRHTNLNDDANAADRRLIGDANLADLPEDLRNDAAVDRHSFADVPGTTLSVLFDAGADAFDVSRVVSTADKYGYDLDSMTAPDGGFGVIAEFKR